MSEYQYYEFRAIDRPLTQSQREQVSALSSRSHVTSHSASFVYNYGGFRGNPEQLIKDYFDAMIYLSNWGTRRLMFRIPRSLIDAKRAGLYCVSEEINQTMIQKSMILDINFDNEELAGWTEGEGWLDEFVGLREELIRGDFRVLYLAWLKAAENAFVHGDIRKDFLEPPVPPGLDRLSCAQETFVRFIGIDEAMLTITAGRSETQQEHFRLEEWIEKLPGKEQQDFLLRLSQDEPNLSILFNRRLLELVNESQSTTEKIAIGQRNISELI